jgi:hypothetical protein
MRGPALELQLNKDVAIARGLVALVAHGNADVADDLVLEAVPENVARATW